MCAPACRSSGDFPGERYFLSRCGMFSGELAWAMESCSVAREIPWGTRTSSHFPLYPREIPWAKEYCSVAQGNYLGNAHQLSFLSYPKEIPWAMEWSPNGVPSSKFKPFLLSYGFIQSSYISHVLLIFVPKTETTTHLNMCCSICLSAATLAREECVQTLCLSPWEPACLQCCGQPPLPS